MTERTGLITQASAHDVAETARRFRAEAEHAGFTIFAEIDHAAGAEAVGLALRPTLLLIFGAARGGTPLMQLDQVAGIDLPLKALVWRDADGAVALTYNDPAWIAERHGLGRGADAPVRAMAEGLSKLAAAATT